MTKKQRQRKRPKKKIPSPIKSKDIQVSVMKQIIEEPQKSKPKKKTPKKRQAKNRVTKLQQFQEQLVPKSTVDQIRLQHISSKIQQNYRTQNQSYLLKIKSQYDQYKQIIVKHALIVEMATEPKLLKSFFRSTILDILYKQILKQFPIKKKNPLQIPTILEKIKCMSEPQRFALKRYFIDLVKKTLKVEAQSEANLRLKIKMEKKKIDDQLQKQAETIQKIRDEEVVEFKKEDFSSIKLINYQELLQEQQKQEILQNVKKSETQNFDVSCLLIKTDPKMIFKDLRSFLLKPTIRPPVKKTNNVVEKSNMNSQISCQSANQNYYTPYHCVNRREEQQQYQQKQQQQYQQKQQQQQQQQQQYQKQQQQQQQQQLQKSQQSRFKQKQNPEPSITPVDVKRTFLASNRPVIKTGLLDGLKELDKYNYNYKKNQTQQQQFEQPDYETNNIYQSRISGQNNNIQDSNRQQIQYSKIYQSNNNNNNNLNQSNLQNSKIQSLRSSTIENEWHSEMNGHGISPLSGIYPSSQSQQFNWVIFINEISNLRLPRQFNLYNLKLTCIQIDQTFFDDFEYIMLSDKFKILILEQKDLVTAEIHMKLGKGDEKGAINSLINKIRFHIQQFMIQYNTRQVIVLIQYSHKFFLTMLLEYIFPQLGQMQEQYRMTPFNQIEELQDIIQDLIENQEQVRADRYFKIPQDLGKFKDKLQNIEFSKLVAMRCKNQLYQKLIQQLIN